MRMANLESIARLAELDGVLLVDKPVNISSHDLIKAVKQYFNLVKVGHGGTLDPNATGLLVVLLGNATRLSADLMGSDRTYSGVLRLGRDTNTFAHPTYDIVRTAEESERVDRLVHVYRFAVTDFAPPRVAFEMSCTKGTMPRVLAHDIGQSLGCGASLDELRRSRCGKFSIENAIGFMDLLKLDAPGFRARVIPMSEVGR